MIATSKKFKKDSSNIYQETNENFHIGYTFTSGGINYRMINESFLTDFDKQYFKFLFTLWILDPINNKWGYVKTDEIIADTNTWRDAENNLYFDLGDNEDANNAFVYSNEVIEEDGEIVRSARIKTLKAGLKTEYDVFYENILLSVVKPQIDASIVYQNMNGITEIV